jgi:hypothetical protein
MVNEIDFLPTKVASLTEAAVQQLMAIANSSPALAKLAADQLEADPRATIARLFTLTATQLAAIQNTPVDDLTQRVLPFISLLRSGKPINPALVHFDPGVSPLPQALTEAVATGGPKPLFKCTCSGSIET